MSDDKKAVEIVLRVRGSFILVLLAVSWLGLGVFLGMFIADEDRRWGELLAQKDRIIELAIEQAERREERVKRIDEWVDRAMTGKDSSQ